MKLHLTLVICLLFVSPLHASSLLVYFVHISKIISLKAFFPQELSEVMD